MRISDLRIILGPIALLVGTIIGTYVGAIGISLLAFPMHLKAIDTLAAEQTVFMTGPKLIYFGGSSIGQPGPKMFFLGASNTAVAFDREKFAPLAKRYTVHNLALGSANVTETKQVASLVLSRVKPAEKSGHVFVIGTWYGLFSQDDRWRVKLDGPIETDLDRERYRYGFAKRSAQGPISLVPEQYISMATYAIYPFLVLDKGMRLATDGLRSRLFVRPPRVDAYARNHQVLNVDERRAAVAYRSADIRAPHLTGEQFAQLDLLLDELIASGNKVFLVNLPIPRWHATATPHHDEYHRRLSTLLSNRAGQPGFTYLNFGALDDADNFYDDVHLRPRSIEPLLKGLANALNAS
jgi:hypothetical protein